MEESNFRDKSVFVTGGSSGIGKAIVLGFARAGAKVHFTYNKSISEANEIVKIAKTENLNISNSQIDFSKEVDFGKLVDDVVNKIQKIDILVNNAGVKLRTEYIDSTVDDWDHTFNVNLRSMYFITQVVAKTMIQNRFGKIINIASQSGLCNVSKSLEYAISKSGVIYMTKSLAKILAKYNITVNAVSPGRTYTNLTNYMNDKTKEEEAIKNIPLGKINTPEDIAEVVLFLSSTKASNITGQILGIDGGECL